VPGRAEAGGVIFDLWRQWLWPTIGLACVNGWAVAATFDDARPRAAAAATAAIVTAAVIPTTLESTLAAAVLLGVLPLAAARPVLLGPALLVTAAIELAITRKLDRIIGLAGAALTMAALTVTAIDGYGWRLLPSGEAAAALAVAGGLVALASRNPVLMAPALLVAATAMPAAPDPHAAIACAIAAVALAAFDRPGPAIAAVGLAAAPLAPAFLLLAAGVLIAAVPWRPALLAATPGAVALTAAVSQEPEAAPAVALAATAALIAWRQPAEPNHDPKSHHTPALALLAWLVLAPAMWRWTGHDFHDFIDPYQEGIAIAATAAVLALAATNLVRLRHAESPDPP
jgi:hypothetical protein